MAALRLPAPPLRGHVLRSAALGCAGVAAMTAIAQASNDEIAVRPIVAVGTFAALMTIAIGAMADTHPFPRFGLANQVTMIRAMLLALVAGIAAGPVTTANAWAAAVTTGVFAALDGVDGLIARRTRMGSVFGARFDMETDALFILVLSLLVWRHDKAGAWVLLAGLMRYGFIAAGWVLAWMAQPLRSTLRGKAVAATQIVALGIATTPIVPPSASRVIVAAALAALVWSFAIDVRYLWTTRCRGQGGGDHYQSGS